MEVKVRIKYKENRKKFEKKKKKKDRKKKKKKGRLRDQPVRGAGYEPSALSGEPIGLIDKFSAVIRKNLWI